MSIKSYLLIIVLGQVGAITFYQFKKSVKAPVYGVPAVTEELTDEAMPEEGLEAAVKPPAPPEDEFKSIAAVSEALKEDEPEVVEEVKQVAREPVQKRIVSTAVDETKKEEKRQKDLQVKIANLNKDLNKEMAENTAIIGYIKALEQDLEAVNQRYRQQEKIEQMREQAHRRSSRTRFVQIPDGESKRLIDRDWNNVNRKLNTARANLVRSQNDIGKLKDKIAATKY